jgi:2-methylisocitrate lyase-like PEP mutase family enzyme
MICVMGSWDHVLDRIQAYTEAGARTLVLRFASADQIRHLESCAEHLSRRGYLKAP